MSLDVNISEPEEFNCIELHSCLQDVAKIIGIENFGYHVDLISGKGENYISNIFRVIYKDSENDKNTASVIVKTLINTERKELFSPLHQREIIAYSEVISKFDEFQSKLEAKEKIYLPKYLYQNKEVIILNDLKDNGFGIGNAISKYDDLSYEQVRLVLTELGKFHGLSYVYARREKENFSEIKQKLEDLLFHESFLSKSMLLNYFFESFDMSLKLVSDIGVRNKLEKIQGKLLDILKYYNEPSAHSVLCHGDLWSNNILFREDDDQSQVCFLDFQAMRYSNPLIDIIYFIYLSTNSEFRSKHLKDLKHTYYDSFSAYLNLYNIDAKDVYSKECFEIDFKDNLPYGLITSLVNLRIITTNPEDETVFKELKNIDNLNIDTVPGELRLFWIKVNDVIEESKNNGAIENVFSVKV